MKTPKWVMTVPVLSTGHLTPETCKGIEEDASNSTFEIYGFYAVTFDTGWMFYNTEDIEMLEEMDLPEDLYNLMVWAYNNDHEWVRVDSAGDRIDDLAYYYPD